MWHKMQIYNFYFKHFLVCEVWGYGSEDVTVVILGSGFYSSDL
jgi:hypothetical protein